MEGLQNRFRQPQDTRVFTLFSQGSLPREESGLGNVNTCTPNF